MKFSEEVCHESDGKYHRIIENISDIIYTCSPDGTITYINSPSSLFGYLPEEVIGRHVTEFVHPDDKDTIIKSFKKAIQTGETFPTTFRLIKSDGQYIYAEEISKVIYKDGKAIQMIGTIRDITRSKQINMVTSPLIVKIIIKIAIIHSNASSLTIEETAKYSVKSFTQGGDS